MNEKKVKLCSWLVFRKCLVISVHYEKARNYCNKCLKRQNMVQAGVDWTQQLNNQQY